LWGRRYDGPASDADGATSVAASPDGTNVFVTGWSEGENTSFDYATFAYDASDGTVQWAARYNGPDGGSDHGNVIASSSDGSRVFVTGYSSSDFGYLDYATVAYRA